MRKAFVALALVAGVAACGGDEPKPQRAIQRPGCIDTTPSADADDVPGELRLDRHATITEVRREGAALGITAVSELSVVELYPPLARAILDAGYSIVASDNEGFEAEIFFGDEDTTGAYRLREGSCGDQVIVRLLFEQGRRR